MCLCLFKIFLSKENLNSDCQQLHLYQQNKHHLSPQIIEHKIGITTYVVGNLCPGLRQVQKCGSAKQVNGILTVPLLIIAASLTGIQI